MSYLLLPISFADEYDPINKRWRPVLYQGNRRLSSNFNQIKTMQDENEVPQDSKKEPQTLMEGLLEQIERVSKLVPIYRQFPGGAIAAGSMDIDLSLARNAITTGDTIAMIQMYEQLKTWQE